MIITSEQVGKGHPDKVADQISDGILTAALKQDKESRVAIETAIGKGKVFITGEITTNADIDLSEIAKLVIQNIDIDYNDFEIIENVSEQSPEINAKVDKDELGAGDQGLMYGYATNETKSLLPIPFALATEILKRYEEQFASKDGEYRFDSKSQTSYDYETKKLININLSVQHSKDKTLEDIRTEMLAMIKSVVADFEKENNISILSDKTEIIINNSGSFVMGGAIADAGLTGRKIIADTYGGWGRHGGGAFSGKDYTKVDRSAAYYARYVATKIIEAKLSDLVEIQVSYIIGKPKPVAINIETFDTEKVSIQEIKEFLKKFDFRLSNIIEELDLKNVDYTHTTLYGHFGKTNLPWK